MFKRIISLLICIILSGVMISIPVAVPAGAAAEESGSIADEEVFYINDFSKAENIEKLALSNCIEPTISVSDDGKSVLRLENTIETNSNASGFFYLGSLKGEGKNGYISITGAPELVFEYKVRFSENGRSSNYFTTRDASELSACITNGKLLTRPNVKVALAEVTREEWNTVTVKYSNSNNTRKVYLNGQLVDEVNEAMYLDPQKNPDYTKTLYKPSVYSTSNYTQFKPHFIAYCINLGDYCEVDYVKLYKASGSLSVEKVETYDKLNELYVKFDSTVFNVSPEMFKVEGSVVTDAEIVDNAENIVKVTLEEELEGSSNYTLSVNGVSNIAEAECNQSITFTTSAVSSEKVNPEKVYFVKEFDAPEDIGNMKNNNCCTPSITVSDDGLSVLRIENDTETNNNASGFFHPNGDGSKAAYLGIEDSPVLVFEYKVRMPKYNRYDYFTTRVSSELTAAIGGYYYVDKVRANASGSVVLGEAVQDQWNTITTVYSNTNGNRKIYINGEFADEITPEDADYAPSVYSTNNYKKFYPHFVAYMKNLGDYCEVDYMKVHTISSALKVEKVDVYKNRNELYVDFDSTVFNVKPEHFTLSGNEILKAEKYDMKENIIKLTLKNTLIDYEKYELKVDGVSNVGEAVCNQSIPFSVSPVSATSPRFFQNGTEIKEYEYSEKTLSVSSKVSNSHSAAITATMYFNAYGEKDGEKRLIFSKSSSLSIPGGEEAEIKLSDISLSSGITEIKAFVWERLTPVSSVATVSKQGYISREDNLPDFGEVISIGNVAFAKKAGAASTGLTKFGYRTYVAMIGTPGYVYEFDTYTGEFLSAFESGSGLQHAIKVGSDGKVYTMITHSPDLYVYDPETRENKLIKAECCQGSSAWSMNYGADDDRSMLYMPVMSSDYKNIGTSVVEYDIDNGVVNTYDGFDIGCKYAHAATGDENYIYVGSADGVDVATVSRMDKKTGEIVTYENDTSVSPGSVTFIKVIGDYVFTKFYSHIIVLNKHTMKKILVFSGGRGQANCISDPDPSNPDLVYYGTNDGTSLLSYNMKTYERTHVMSTTTSYGNYVRWDFGRWIPDKDGNLGIAGIGGTEDNPGLFHIIPSEKKLNHIYCDYGDETLGVPTRPSYFYLSRDDILYVGGYEAGLNGFDIKTNTPLFSVANGNQHGMTMVDGKLFGGSYGKSSIYMYDPAKKVSSTNPKAVSSTAGVNRFYHTSDTNAGFGLSVGIADYGNPEGGVILMTYLNKTPKFKYYIGVIPGENIIGVAYKDGYIYASSSVTVPLYEDTQHEEAHVAKIDATTGETVLMTTVNFDGLPKTTKIGEIRFGPDGLLYGKSNAGQTVFALKPDDLSLVKYKSYYPDETPAPSYIGEWLIFGDEGNLYAVLSGDLHCINIETMESNVISGSCHNFTIDNDGNILKPKTYSSTILDSIQVNKRQRLEIMIKNAQKYYKKNDYSEDSWAVYEAALNEALEMDIAEAYLPDVVKMARKLGFAIRDLQTVYDANAGFAFPFK